MSIDRADFLNGLFEFAGAAMGVINIVTLLRHKKVRGFSPLVYTYFTSWGLWNCFYYPHLTQWFSFIGTVAITVSNGLFCGLALHYLRLERRQHVNQ